MRLEDYTLRDFTISEIAGLCHVSLKTAKRWRDGTICPPHHILSLLIGDLGVMHSAWKGWRLIADKLYTPDGLELLQGDVRAIPFMRMQIHNYQLEFRQMQMSWYEDQPLPDSWADIAREVAAVMK